MQTSFHPAPGLGDLLNGWFVLPQNPIRDQGTVIAPSVMAIAPNQPLRIKGTGELLAGSFVVPQNPVEKVTGLGCGCGCGAGDGNYNYGLSGLGQTTTDTTSSITDFLTGTPIASVPIPMWAWLGAGAVAAYMLMQPGGSAYRARRKSLDAEYRGYRRLGRAVAES